MVSSTFITAENNDHLRKLIDEAVEDKGIHCDLNHIDVSEITDFSETFSQHPLFDGDISRWNVANATDMTQMFRNSKFTGDISRWDVSKVVRFDSMFQNSAFNGDLSQWSTVSATEFDFMFFHSQFNGDLSKWNTSCVTSMYSMFAHSPFQGHVSSWDTSCVTDMTGMFEGTPFNADVSNWSTGSVTNTRGMFKNSAFNGDVSRWDTRSLTEAHSMFEGSPFSGDLSSWQLPRLNLAKSRDMFPMGFVGTPPFIGAAFNDRLRRYHDLHGGTQALTDYLERTPFNRVHFDIAAHSPRKPQGISKKDWAWARNMGEVGRSLGMDAFALERYALSQYGQPSTTPESAVFAFEAP